MLLVGLLCLFVFYPVLSRFCSISAIICGIWLPLEIFRLTDTYSVCPLSLPYLLSI